ncbi:MAG: CehA/McbA family metallohydrolase [Myxococcota bacterium]
MRHALLLASALLVLACPEKKPIPPPEPSGRCEVDLEALQLFSNVGAGASAAQIASADQLVGGNWAQGVVGDYLLENDRVRVVIQAPGRTISPTPYGGTIIDADLKRTGAGRDEFGKLESIYAFGRTINVKKVEVLNDGSKGGYAVIAATGTDEVIDYVNVTNVVEEFLGAGVQLVVDPDAPLPLTATTYYVLSPGETRVRVLTAYCNGGKDNVVMQVGDLIEQGGVSEIFNPGGCTNGLGARSCLVDPAPWFGYQADGVAYGYRAYKFSGNKTPATNALLYVAGVAAVLADGQDSRGLLSWTDPNATSRPGSFGVLAGQSRTFLRDFYVGRDLAEISSTILANEAASKSRLTVTVQHADGSPAPGGRVAIRTAETGTQVTLAVADDQGKARVDLPPGNYLVGTAALGAAIEPFSAVAVPGGGDATATVKEGASRTLTVTVKDPFGAPLSGKVIVRCPQGPCANQAIDYRPWFDVEDQPSDEQAIVFVGASGSATIALPPGQYEVLVTRGPEYSAWPDTYPSQGQAVDLTTQDQSVAATLAHVVDTTGWMSADLHVHAMGSPDSVVANSVRVSSFAAEGVDVMVSTDHDFVTDYAPVIDRLGLSASMASMIGCEVTPFDFGHHNTYPIARLPGLSGGAFDWGGGDGPTLRLDQLYAGLRARDPDVIIQMNHPRGTPGGALTQVKVDTATGASHADPSRFRQEPNPAATATDTKLFSPDFDAFEVMNGTGPNYAVLNDWMTFLSKGWVKTATGVSDTHQARAVTGGYGRTWVRLGADTAAQFTVPAFRDALKAKRATFGNGPFLTMQAQRLDANDMPVGTAVDVGGTISVGAGEKLRLTVDVQAPEWMQFDAVEIYTHTSGREAVNGESNASWPDGRIHQKRTLDPTMLPLEPVPGLNGFSARRVYVTETFVVSPTADTWYVAMVRSSTASRPLAPLAWDGVGCSGGICTPKTARAFAVTNAILVDGDASGAYDDFPLKGQPLTAAPPMVSAPVARRVPSLDELETFLRRVLSHDHE